MNSAALEPVRWSWRRWVYSVAALFVLQAALIYFQGQHDPRLPERPIFRTAIHLIGEESAVQRLTALPEINDPALLALPNLQGFSGPAWLQFAPLDYQPVEGDEPTHWVELDQRQLGTTFGKFLATNAIQPLLVADKPAPPLLLYEPNFPNEPITPASRLRVEGSLASRPLVTPPELQSWPHSELLSNTVIEVTVDADGFTFSPVLLHDSGLRQADESALKLALDARFRPLRRNERVNDGGRDITWGRLVFQWHTLPLPATNLSVSPP